MLISIYIQGTIVSNAFFELSDSFDIFVYFLTNVFVEPLTVKLAFWLNFSLPILVPNPSNALG